MGTMFTRARVESGDCVGQWPYQAVAMDAVETKDQLDKGHLTMFGTFGFVSLPIDFAFDTILLPADLIFWPFGFKKPSEVKLQTP